MSAIPCPEPIYSTLGNDPDLGNLVRQFVAELPNRVATLEAALACGDWDGVRRTAHQMKGAAGSYGFGGLTPFAAAVEGCSTDDQTEQALCHLVEELIEVCRRLRGGEPPLRERPGASR